MVSDRPSLGVVGDIYIYPPRPSMRLTTDILAYCRQRLPRWHAIPTSGYRTCEAGTTARQEVAFTLGNMIAYKEDNP